MAHRVEHRAVVSVSLRLPACAGPGVSGADPGARLPLWRGAVTAPGHARGAPWPWGGSAACGGASPAVGKRGRSSGLPGTGRRC